MKTHELWSIDNSTMKYVLRNFRDPNSKYKLTFSTLGFG